MRIWITALCLAPLLAACGDSSTDELRNWMTEQKAQGRPRAADLAAPKQFTPADYDQRDAVDPFSPDKLTQALQRDTTRTTVNTALLTPELARRKEPLEAFPLDSMAMVGSLIKTGQPASLVRVGSMLYQVRVGEHLGQNYGRVTAITETETTVREIVQDPTGDWVERNASLQLQERTK